MLLIVRPSHGFFEPAVLVPVVGAVNYAFYIVLTRMAGRVDPPMTSFFYTGIAGAATISLVGPFFWSTITGWNWAWMAVLCATSTTGHYLLIRAYSILDASAVQPISYVSLVYAALVGTIVFQETLGWGTIVGSLAIVAAGCFTIWREYARRAPPPVALAEAEHP